MKLSQGTHEQTVEALLDAAGKVLEATYEDEQRSRQAITSLERLRTTVEEKVGTLSRDTVKLIEGSSEATATQAAKLLREKFVEADVAAEHARARYVRATHSLGWRLFGLAVLVQLLIFVGVWVIVARTLPSQDDIAARRQTLQELAQQISGQQSQAAELDRQIKAKQRKVNDLDRRGGLGSNGQHAVIVSRSRTSAFVQTIKREISRAAMGGRRSVFLGGTSGGRS